MMAASLKKDMTIADAVVSFTDTVEGLADLGLHRAVDETVDAIAAHVKTYHGIANVGRAVIQVTRTSTVRVGEYMDPDDKLVDALGGLVPRFERGLAVLTAKKGCIDTDARLNESHCDMLHTSYDDMLVALACVIEVTKDLQAAIISHDLAAEPRDGARFSTVEELRRGILH